MRNVFGLLLFSLLLLPPAAAAETAVDACARLAANPDEGVGVGAPFESLATGDALSVCSKAHAQAPGSAQTTYRLGRVLLAKERDVEAAQLFLEAALTGYPTAQAAYGRSLRDGRGVQWDPVASFTWLKRAADQGDAASLMQLGTYYLDGFGVARDLDKAEQAYLAAAANGKPASYWGLGNMYSRGMYGRIDRPRAIRFYERALAAEVPEAGVDLGVLKLCTCPERDVEGAVALLETAGEQGVARAWLELGLVYLDERSDRHDDARSLAYFRQAAEAGDLTGNYYVGLFSIWGLGVPQDDAEAEKWLRIAATGGLPSAQLALGRLYTSTPGGPGRVNDGVIWLERAAAAGIGDAFYHLYDHFLSIPVNDLDRAYEYALIASQFPDPGTALAGRNMMNTIMDMKRFRGLEPPLLPADDGRG